MPDSDVHILYYSPSINRFADENWCIIHNLNVLFDTWQLDRWKSTRDHGLIRAKNGDVWKLYYLSNDEEDDVFDNFIALTYPNENNMYRNTQIFQARNQY